LLVIPAKAGSQLLLRRAGGMAGFVVGELKCDSGLRRNDDVGVFLVIPAKAGIAVVVAKDWGDGWLRC